jgi:hypothetical protein
LHADRSGAGIGSQRHENARVENCFQVSHRNGAAGMRPVVSRFRVCSW